MIRYLAVFLCVPLFGAEADAIAISRIIQQRHTPYGTIIDPVFASPTSDEIVSYSRCGDSAIWTGHYLAAEAFRYKVTGSADALDNARRAFSGLKSLMDVTGTNLLARCIFPVGSRYAADMSSEESRHGVYTNSAQAEHYQWIGNTSRDQYSGVMFGLAVAHDMIEDAAFRAAIREQVTRIVDFLRGGGWTVRMPGGGISTTFLGRADQQLSFLQVARHVNPDRYSTDYDVARFLSSAAVLLPISLEVTDNGSYFKFNLDHINLYNLVRLESSSFGEVYRTAYDVLRKHTGPHQNAFFNLIDRALTGPDRTRDAETVRLLEEWLRRPRRDDYLDLRSKYSVCGGSDTACQVIPVIERVRTDFLWQRDPYLLYGGGDGKIEGAGIDYILPYWMARYYLNADLKALSAASGAVQVASESVASLYGFDLAPRIEPATGVTLPASLSGVSVQVKDSAGTTRTAPLFFVSPGQINFLVPQGTTAGAATITVNGQSGVVARATAQVQSVAPALFTATADGKGIAAAVATRGSSSAPIFQCDGKGSCTGIAVDLSGGPVYLSLYGTGIRNRRSLGDVSVTVGGQAAVVQYAGPQGVYNGLDQVNILVPAGLKGEMEIVVKVEGQAANTVRAVFR